MHKVKLIRMLSNAHMMMLLMAFLAKPMFRVKKPLFKSKQTMVMTWHNIPRFVREYFATSFNSIHVEKIYIKNIP